MSDKKDSYMSEDERGYEWHLEYPYTPGMPCPFPIVPAGTRPKHDAVGHLTPDGRIHVFNDGIIERLVRAGLRALCGTREVAASTRR
jgi:hypothetical protein